MKVKNYLAILLLCCLTGCAATGNSNQRPANASNYDTELKTPKETENFIQTDREVFDDPAYGVMVRYENKFFAGDNITLYVYPVDSVNLKDKQKLAKNEADYVVKEIESAVEHGLYQSVELVKSSEVKFSQQGNAFSGQKTLLKIVDKYGNPLFSVAYIFVQQDKFIKFRVSTDSTNVNSYESDVIVKELLPNISVPPESEFMRTLRAEHKKQMQQQLMKLLMQAMKEKDAES